MKNDHPLYQQSSRAHGQSITVTICNHQMCLVEYQGQRVVTLAMIDEVHKRPEGTARKRFNDNKKRLTEGKHFFELTASEIRTQSLTNTFSPRTTKGILITEYGYMLLAKSLTDDLAWKVQEQLVDSYFRSRTEAQLLPQTYIEALEHLLDAKKSEQAAIAQRDQAIADLEAAKPAVEFVENYVQADGSMSFRQVAKLLKTNEREFREFLKAQKIMYRLGSGEWMPYQPHIDIGRFEVKTGTSERNGYAFAQARFTSKGVQWIAERWDKHQTKAQGGRHE